MNYFELEALSYSGLKDLSKGANYYRYFKDNPRPTTAAQRLGTLIHLRVLEPQKFAANVKIVEGDRRSKSIREKVQLETEKGYYVLKPKEFEQIDAVGVYVLNHPTVKQLLKGGEAERIVRWEKDGIQCKCRPDYLRVDDGFVIDLKTTQELDVDSIERTIRKYKYHWQAAWYLEGVESVFNKTFNNKFFHIFVRADHPIDCVVYTLADVHIEDARAEYAEYVQLYKDCVRSNYWPGQPQEIKNLVLRHYG